MRADGIDTKIIRAGNDNLFQSEIFSTTLSTLIGQTIEIYNTTGAIGAARAAGLEKENINQFSKSSVEYDKVSEIFPKSNTQPYEDAYQKWKLELEQKIDNQ